MKDLPKIRFAVKGAVVLDPCNATCEESAVARYLILHYGFEKPTADQMTAWNEWFSSIGDIQIERGHLPLGRELSDSGTTELPFGADSITGYTMIKAESLDDATRIAQDCPIVLSTRVYEIRG